jgi:hypothetical protein
VGQRGVPEGSGCGDGGQEGDEKGRCDPRVAGVAECESGDRDEGEEACELEHEDGQC